MKTNLTSILLSVVIALAASFIFISLIQAQSGPPAIPHGQAGFEKCLDCHGPAAIKPAPADHAGYPQVTCTGCHKYSTETAPTAAPTTPAPAPPKAQESGDSYCLSCHSQSGLSFPLTNGEKLNLSIDGGVLATSVHGNKLLCTDCHTAITGYPHPANHFASLREFSTAQYELCKQCHFANYTKSLDSVHYKGLAQGAASAPLCTDCHGAHNVSHPDQPRSKVSTTCSKCHADINEAYVQSAHGKALMEDNNFDVPVCTDCHRSHTIEDPRTATFRSQSVDLCSNCHADQKLMKKYGISTNVVKSYLQDFHGSTVALMSQESKDIWVNTAVCTDCHGVHDIKVVTDADSSVIKANLSATCAKCHPGTSTSFPGAWLSHYEPSISKAPLVFVVQWFYRIMIPFIVVGLLAHIVLDIWRALTNR